jgi:hypothetical protein
MKKLLLSQTLVLAMGLCANAQRDSYFNDWDDVGNGLDKIEFDYGGLRDPGLPGGHGGGDTPAPLGTGLVILTALGAGYAFAKKRD